MSYRVRLDDGFQLDFSNVMKSRIGIMGLTEDEIGNCPGLDEALSAMKILREKGEVRGHSEKVYFTRLPYQSVESEQLRAVEEWGRKVRAEYRYLVSLGIGGSYLGNQVLVDALKGPLWNAIPGEESGPKIFFSGNNVDPSSIRSLEKILDLEQTMFVVISKSGATMETMAAFLHFYHMVLGKGLDPSRHFTVVTDSEKGLLHDIAQEVDLPAFVVPYGVGGRWSVLTDVGLLIAAAAGISIGDLLEGAQKMVQIGNRGDIFENPPCLYAAICTLLYRNHGIHESVLMPYSDALKSFALWYVQLLAESLGKEKNRSGDIVHEGRTPIAAVGTSDMHAQTQQHREGKKNKLVTTIALEAFGEDDIALPAEGEWTDRLSFIAGRSFSELLHAARRANEESLASDGRPSCCLSIPGLNAYTLGQLFYFFEMATAFEGELLNVNAFDQPGVEHYKKIMKSILL